MKIKIHEIETGTTQQVLPFRYVKIFYFQEPRDENKPWRLLCDGKPIDLLILMVPNDKIAVMTREEWIEMISMAILNNDVKPLDFLKGTEITIPEMKRV